MKKTRLNESAVSQETIATAIKISGAMNQAQKDGWFSRIQKCIEDLGYGRISKADIVTGGFGFGLIIAGIKLNIPVLCVMGAVTIGALAHFDMDVWVKIIDCAKKSKHKSVTDTGNSTNITTQDNSTNMSTPEQSVQESKTKKVIRLTESELVELVQRIIKEDESMGTEMTSSTTMTLPKGFVRVSLKDLLSGKKDLQDSYSDPRYSKGAKNDYDYYKLNKYFFTVISGKAFERVPDLEGSGIAPITRILNPINSVFYIKDNTSVEINITESKGSAGDIYRITASNNVVKIQLTQKSSG